MRENLKNGNSSQSAIITFLHEDDYYFPKSPRLRCKFTLSNNGFWQANKNRQSSVRLITEDIRTALKAHK